MRNPLLDRSAMILNNRGQWKALLPGQHLASLKNTLKNTPWMTLCFNCCCCCLCCLVFQHDDRVPRWKVSLDLRKFSQRRHSCAIAIWRWTYEIMPPIAMKTPRMLLSPTVRPLVIQPRATIEHVLTCPTTVLETGPVWATIKNCDKLMREAKAPLCIGRKC